MARLPQVGSDADAWGDVLNTYLNVGHDDSGHHRMGWVVTEYGADNTGTDDAGEAINAVIQGSSEGDAIIFPGGQYIIETPVLLLPNRNYYGLGNPVLYRKDNTPMDAVVMVDQTPAWPMLNIRMANITVDGNSDNNTVYPVTGSPSPIYATLTFTGNATGWYASGPGAVTYDAAVYRTDAGSGKLTATANGNPAIATTVLSGQGIPAEPGRSYTFMIYSRAATTGRDLIPSISWYNDDNTLISVTSAVAQANNTSGWTQVGVDNAECPAGATKFAVRVTVDNAANGEAHHFDDATITHTLNGGHNIWLDHVANCALRDVNSINAANHGIRLDGTWTQSHGNRFAGCEVRYASNAGIYFGNGVFDSHIYDSAITDSFGGLEIAGFVCTINNTSVRDNTHSGIRLYDGGCSIIGCQIERNYRRGIYLGAYAWHTLISGCKIYANSLENDEQFSAISCDGTSGVPVKSPTILGNFFQSRWANYGYGGAHFKAISLGEYHDNAVVNGNSVQLGAVGGGLSTELQVEDLKAGDIYNGVAWTGNLHAHHGHPPGTTMAALRQTVSQTLANAGVPTYLTFDTQDEILLDAHSTSTNPSRWTCPIDGKYRIRGTVAYGGNGTGTFRSVLLARNGTALPGSYAVRPPMSAAFPMTVDTPELTVDLAAGDYIQVAGFHDATANIASRVSLYQSSLTIVAA